MTSLPPSSPPGTSLQVYSAFRLVEAAKRSGAKVVAINVGETRADKLLDMKLEVLAGEAMIKLATHDMLMVPKLVTSDRSTHFIPTL